MIARAEAERRQQLVEDMVPSGSLYRRTHSPSRLAWSKGRQPLGAVLHSSNEPGELSQWLCHDDSTINVVLVIIIIVNICFINVSSSDSV